MFQAVRRAGRWRHASPRTSYPSARTSRLSRRALPPLEFTELSLFGSAPREDFRADSDIDLLVRFARDAEWSLLDHAKLERDRKDRPGVMGS
jgi:predicted nucleotidyltransferase